MDIRTLGILEGTISRRALPLILEWALVHRAELMQDLELCRLNWPGDIDLAPDAMYAEIKAHGRWRL